MLGMKLSQTFHITGTLTANVSMTVGMEAGATLIAVSCVGSNAHDATLDVGTSVDTDGVLAGKDIGDSNTPTIYRPVDWNGALATANQPYHFVKDDILQVAVDYDGSSGTAIADLTLVLTFLEG